MCVVDDGHYYIGAKLLPNGQAVWDGKSVTFSLTDVPAYQPNSSCVAIVVVNVSDETESSLEAVPCHQPMNYNFICKEGEYDVLLSYCPTHAISWREYGCHTAPSLNNFFIGNNISCTFFLASEVFYLKYNMHQNKQC